MDICSCKYCIEGDYAPEEFVVTEEQFLNLDKERPFGLTGHLRVKNEALTLAKCIESVIDVLDELIITYDKSQDNTREIAVKYAAQYPEKIRFFDYKPFVAPHGRLRNEESNLYPESSIHNSANYYNYGMVKTTFKYYMKVDGDQVYFTEKLRYFKEILRQLETLKPQRYPGFVKKACRFITNMIRKLSSRYPKYTGILINNRFWFLLFAFSRYPDFSFSLAGINAHEKDKKLVSLINPLHYNGAIGDTVIWSLRSSKRYRWDDKMRYEIIDIPTYALAGFFWIHYKYIKIPSRRRSRNALNNTIKLEDLVLFNDLNKLLQSPDMPENIFTYKGATLKILRQLVYGFFKKDIRYFDTSMIPYEEFRKKIESEEVPPD